MHILAKINILFYYIVLNLLYMIYINNIYRVPTQNIGKNQVQSSTISGVTFQLQVS